MTNIKGQHLYVNLSASQVRQRLKGFGHGVRKIQSAGKNRSLIIHTATGDMFLVKFSAIPEPTTITLLLCGMAGLALLRRRR